MAPLSPLSTPAAADLSSLRHVSPSQGISLLLPGPSSKPSLLLGHDTTACCAVRCEAAQESSSRRRVLQLGAASVAALGLSLGDSREAHAILANRRAMREKQIPEEDYTVLPSGLKVYEIKVGGGRLAQLGDRVTVHYVVKWKGITFMTSRQGQGVTGGTPYGFDVGSSDIGYVLKGLDLGVQGMRVGGQRQLIVPPELAYGKKGIQEIPPNATLEMNIELLSIKESPIGFQVKLVEG